MPLPGANSVVPGPRESLLDLGCGGNQVVGTAQSSAKGDHLGGEHNAGPTMN